MCLCGNIVCLDSRRGHLRCKAHDAAHGFTSNLLCYGLFALSPTMDAKLSLKLLPACTELALGEIRQELVTEPARTGHKHKNT